MFSSIRLICRSDATSSTRTLGKRSKSAGRCGTTERLPNSGATATRSSPDGSVRPRLGCVSRPANSSSTRRPLSWNTRPASVSESVRDERFSNCAPSQASSRATCLLAADWPMPASFAAAEKLPLSTTRTNSRMASRRSI